MRTLVLNLGLLLLIGCSSGRAQMSREHEFWRWFQANETKLFDFDTDRERVFDELERELHKVNPGLTFEFGPKENGVRDFVISADGIKEVFPSVIALGDAAPSLQRWKVIKFRPRRASGPVVLNGIKLSPDQIDFTIEPDAGKVGITLFIEGYTEAQHERYAAVAFLMLDSALGEYDVETKIGGIDFMPRTAKSGLPKQPFSALVKSFDTFGNRR